MVLLTTLVRHFVSHTAYKIKKIAISTCLRTIYRKCTPPVMGVLSRRLKDRQSKTKIVVVLCLDRPIELFSGANDAESTIEIHDA